MSKTSHWLAIATIVPLVLVVAVLALVTTGAARDQRADQACGGPFTGVSKVSIQAATHNAATVAVKRSSAGACRGATLRVIRTELVLSNPHVREYRVTLRG